MNVRHVLDRDHPVDNHQMIVLIQVAEIARHFGPPADEFDPIKALCKLWAAIRIVAKRQPHVALLGRDRALLRRLGTEVRPLPTAVPKTAPALLRQHVEAVGIVDPFKRPKLAGSNFLETSALDPGMRRANFGDVRVHCLGQCDILFRNRGLRLIAARQ